MTAGEVRDQIWTTLMKAREVSYPLPPYGHHPNFKGASKAAGLLLEYLFAQNHLKAGQTVLCYPDYVLKSVRKGLLEHGVNVIVPAQHGNNYRLLESAKVNPVKASSIAGAEKAGEDLSELPEVVMVFVACVGVSKKGHILDKGYGFTLPNLALPSVTIAHPLQIVEELPEAGLHVYCYATPDDVCMSRSNLDK
jgi:5-formyltetrahydrofolate cyclo-ligase